jgi:di- and tripeptidase
VSDNKGPLLAFAHAASKLLMQQQLNIDLVMLIEGEEEAGSKNLLSIIRQHKVSDTLMMLADCY